MRKGDWKLLEYYEDNQIELYNLNQNLGEATNQASAKPEIAEQIRSKLHDWRAHVGVLHPKPNPNL